MTSRLAVLVGLLVVPPLSAQTTIETISFWDGDSYVFPLGKDNTATYGQAFTVPGTDNVLQSFSFFLRDYAASDELVFQAYVSAWDGSKLTGRFSLRAAIRAGPARGRARSPDMIS